MRLPRLRLRVGTLLIAVAAFALGIGADRFYSRFDRLMTMAARYGNKAEAERKNAADAEKVLASSQSKLYPVEYIDDMREFSENSKASAAYSEHLRSMCVRAAFLPFLPAPDDQTDWAISWGRPSLNRRKKITPP